MSHRPAAFFILLLLTQHFLLVAQTGMEPNRYDLKIARFYEKNQRDSFVFYINEKLRLARQADSLAIWGWTQLEIHDFYTESGSDEQALKILEDAWKNRWREPASPAEWEPFLYVQQNRGWCLFQAGKVWQAVQAYESASEIYERFRYADFDAVETIYKPLGAHYTRLGDNEKAITVFEKALRLGGDNETTAGLYSNIGIAHWNRGDFTSASGSFRRGLELKDISASKKALLLSGLAQATLDAGQKQDAYDLSGQALAWLRTRADMTQTIEYRAYARRVAGLAATAIGRYAEADQLLSGALADATAIFGKFSRDAGKVEVARSELFRKQGKLMPSLEAANRALRAVLPGFQPLKPMENPGAGSFYEENVLFEALEAKAQAAESMYQKNSDPAWLTFALECHDLAWQAEIRLRRVHQYSSSKLHLQQSARAREESAMHVTRLLFEKTAEVAYIEKALTIAERSKATLLLDAARDNLLRQDKAGSDARFAQITALRRSLAYFERNLLLEPANIKAAQWRIEADALGSQIARLERELAVAYPRIAGEASAAADAVSATAGLAEDEALVAYFTGKNFLDIFIFQKNKPAAWRRLPNDDNLTLLAGHFLSFFENSAAILNAPLDYLQTAHSIWQKIMPEEATAATRLLIIPDGFLNFIPFEALVVAPAASTTSLRNAAYLIEKQEVRYAWSLSVLRQQNNLKNRTHGFMLAIAPGFNNGERGLAPLKSGNSEWQSAGGSIKELIGPNADAQHFFREAGNYRILHFSSHAFSDDNPRIELYDQALLLPDIYALSIYADLVVLSACQTGLGRVQTGEGVMSLTRAFAQAGSACIVSSLWSVNDRSTAQLLNRFYQNLRDGNNICMALRQAKLAYLTDTKVGVALQSPYFWAGLTAMGADRKITGAGLNRTVFMLLAGGAIVIFSFIAYRYMNQRKMLQ